MVNLVEEFEYKNNHDSGILSIGGWNSCSFPMEKTDLIDNILIGIVKHELGANFDFIQLRTSQYERIKGDRDLLCALAFAKYRSQDFPYQKEISTELLRKSNPTYTLIFKASTPITFLEEDLLEPKQDLSSLLSFPIFRQNTFVDEQSLVKKLNQDTDLRENYQVLDLNVCPETLFKPFGKLQGDWQTLPEYLLVQLKLIEK